MEIGLKALAVGEWLVFQVKFARNRRWTAHLLDAYNTAAGTFGWI
jgi:hypothetical protein